jgi:hypothetical protein
MTNEFDSTEAIKEFTDSLKNLDITSEDAVMVAELVKSLRGPKAAMKVDYKFPVTIAYADATSAKIKALVFSNRFDWRQS